MTMQDAYKMNHSTTSEGKEGLTMNNATTNNATTSEGKEGLTMKEFTINLFSAKFAGMECIEYKPVMRSNERVLVYDIRCALIDNNCAALLSLVKAWYIMAKKPDVQDVKTVDTKVVELTTGLIKLAYSGKKASVHERKDNAHAIVDVMNTGRIKAWLYTLAENRFDMIAQAGERPTEKISKRTTSPRNTIKLAGNAYTMADIQRMIDAGELSVNVK